MQDLPFVDAHVHLWDMAQLRYAWLSPPFTADGPNGSVEPIAATYLPDDYRAESRGWNVAGIVHVEAGADPAQSIAETDWVEHVCADTDLPMGIVAFAALDDPQLEELLEAQSLRNAVRGIRHIVNWHENPRRTYTPRDVTGDQAWQNGFALLAKYGLSFDCQAYPGQFPELARLFARHPDIPVVVNHAGMGVDDPAEWRTNMQLLAALPHVSVKISGLGFCINPWAAGRVRGRVMETIDIFGTDRAMFASDFPTDRLFAPFDAVLGAYADAIADLNESERRSLFAGNANRIYRLGLDL